MVATPLAVARRPHNAKTFLCSHGHFETDRGAGLHGSIAIRNLASFLESLMIAADNAITHPPPSSQLHQSTACASTSVSKPRERYVMGSFLAMHADFYWRWRLEYFHSRLNSCERATSPRRKKRGEYRTQNTEHPALRRRYTIFTWLRRPQSTTPRRPLLRRESHHPEPDSQSPHRIMPTYIWLCPDHPAPLVGNGKRRMLSAALQGGVGVGDVCRSSRFRRPHVAKCGWGLTGPERRP